MLNGRTTIGWRAAWAAIVVTAGVAAAADGGTAGTADTDWPCVQRLVPGLSAAAVWDGPDFDSVRNAWRERPAVRQLVSHVASRRTDSAEAEKAIATFGGGLQTDIDATLTAVFAGIFTVIDDDRSQLIAGIKRYSKNQQRLASRIRDAKSEIEGMVAKGVPVGDPRLQQLREQWEWDTRIHKDREKSLTAMCEQPVILEQRLFVLARAIREVMTR